MGKRRDDIFFEAFRTKDRRFDGKFFLGVKTTGIYCRPICPAKPKRENIEYFATRKDAERAGYRACLRCHPERAPGSAAWQGTASVVKRAIRALPSIETRTLNENEFAERFGVSARHLRRLFREEVGRTPKQLIGEIRLSRAKKLLTETDRPVGEIAFEAGFRSVRRFHDAFRKRFKRSPLRLRASRGKSV